MGDLGGCLFEYWGLCLPVFGGHLIDIAASHFKIPFYERDVVQWSEDHQQPV